MTDQPGETGQTPQPPSGQQPPQPQQPQPPQQPQNPPTQQFGQPPSGPPQGPPQGPPTQQFGQPPQGPPQGPPTGPQQFGGFGPGGQPPKKSKKGLIIGLVSGGVALLLILGVALVFIVISANHRADVEEADRAATRYSLELSSFRSRAYSSLSARSSTPSTLKSEIDRLANDVPEPPNVPDYGKENSERFQDEIKKADNIKEAIENVEDAAENAADAAEYADAAERVIASTPTSLLPSIRTNGSRVRAQIVNVLQARLDTFLRIEAPEGMDSLRSTVSSQMTSVINSAKSAARSLDGGARSVFIRYGTQYSLIRTAVFSAESKSRTELRTALGEILRADSNSSGSSGGSSGDNDDV